jgi:hypothetical protein
VRLFENQEGITDMARVSQVQSKVEAKPNIASLPKLRCSSGQQAWLERRTERMCSKALTLTTCCRLSVCISRRSKSVPVHFDSTIVRLMVLSEARIAAKLKVRTNVIRNEVIVWSR